jgi:RNA polymerase sigma-70 factor (ECF subfamily)
MDLYRRYGPALLRKCERLLGNPSDAEDVVHTVFVEILRRKKTDADLPYLYRAATNRCLNLIRDRKKQRSLLEQQTDVVTPSRALLSDQVIDMNLLCKLVNDLDKKSSQILIYRYVDDLGQEEIAELMNTSRKTVGKRLKKIRQKALALVPDSPSRAATATGDDQ